ncbi:Uu.00g035770.m01.CDS01 [Anthostomella pinea]|uniref:Uu.00g035770.m01.CDS01 n=1 Tax=Anthostomella pinea TaxID=933095 RepID=A0AAI8V961_9PEZI|nr:Uu.00g035770.m01.CDS01 [Anthostomella pinea]
MSNNYSNERVAGKEHIPLYPRGFIAVRIIQLVVAVVCLGLCAYGVTYLVYAGDALMLFTAIATIIASVYCLVSHYGPSRFFNYWAILGLDVFLVIFWLISFAILAAQVAAGFFYSTSDYYDDYYGYYKRSADTDTTTYAACMAAAAGLGGVEFILYVVSLVIHSIMLYRHRKAGLKCVPGKAASATAGGEKIQMQPQQPQGYAAAGSPPVQQTYSAPQQQSIYAQPQAPSPLSAQTTGDPYAQHQPVASHEPVYEIPGQGQPHHT